MLVDDGPEICCTPPSNGFSYTGSVALSVEPGDTYGFTMTGSNGDLNSFLNGTLTYRRHGAAAGAPPGRSLDRRDERDDPRTRRWPAGDLDHDRRLDCRHVHRRRPGRRRRGRRRGHGGDRRRGLLRGERDRRPAGRLRHRPPHRARRSPLISTCIVSSADNDFWPKALASRPGRRQRDDVIDIAGKARWYKFRRDARPADRRQR